MNTGLREQKRKATRRAIEEAAVEIALEQGYEAATAEAIATRAGVSLRTLFNYFPTKDVAIAGRGIALVDEHQARRLLDENEPNVFVAIARIVAAATAEADSDLMRRRHDLIFRTPSLLQQHLRAIDETEATLARLVAEYLRDKPSRRRLSGRVAVEEEARLIVAIVGAAIRYSLDTWLESRFGALDAGQILENTINLITDIHRRDP